MVPDVNDTPAVNPQPRLPAARRERSEARAWRALVDAAAAPYRPAGRFAWHFARGKLRYDPVFRHLLETGLICRTDSTPAHEGPRVIDIGCGQGLLASVLLACEARVHDGQWPSHWATPPRGATVTGIELMARDVARARAALGERAHFVCGDMREVPFSACDTVVILDVLHYIPIADQDRVLARVNAALAPGGKLLLRVGDAAAPRGFIASQWVDRVVTRVRGHRTPPTFGRALSDWQARLGALGFSVQARPMSRGTPFSNVLLVAQRGPGPTSAEPMETRS